MNKKWKAGPPTTHLSAAELVARGYRKTSNAYGMVSRIDRPDWVDVLAKKYRKSPAEFCIPAEAYPRGEVPIRAIERAPTAQPSGHWADHYRCVYSKDTHTVTHETLKGIPSSNHDPVGYIDPKLFEDLPWQ